MLCPGRASLESLRSTRADDAKASCYELSTDKTAQSRAQYYTQSDEVHRGLATSLQTLAKPQSASESLKERRYRWALLQVYHGLGVRMWLYLKGRGLERGGGYAVGVSNTVSRQRVAEKEHVTPQKGDVPSKSGEAWKAQVR